MFLLQAAVAGLLGEYVARLSEVAGSLITCGPVLNWLELDNRGHRLIVTDDSDINTPAVAAAYVVKRYTAQASDEISFEVSACPLHCYVLAWGSGGDLESIVCAVCCGFEGWICSVFRSSR